MKVAFNTSPLKNAHRTRGVGFYTKNLLEHLLKETLEIIQFTDIKKLSGVDLVHYPWFDLFFRSLPLVKLYPTIVTVHDVMPLIFKQGYPVGIRGRLNFQYQKFSLQGCKAVITVSQSAKKDIIKYLNVDPEKITVIAEAAGDSFLKLAADEKDKIKRKLHLPKRFLLYVGDVNFVKNLPFLIKAFGEVVKEQPELKLVLVGGAFLKKAAETDHPELASLKLMNKLIEELNLKEKVIRLGQLETKDLVGVYNLAVVYIQPSLYEGFGLPILEAMSCGTPVVCSDRGSLPEVGGNAAYYFNPEKESSLIESLLKLLTDEPLRDKLSMAGLKQAKKFSWEKAAQETIRLYEQVIKK